MRSPPDRANVVVADGFAQLVAHVFAHVELDRAGNLYDPRYVAWARQHLSADATAVVEHDARLIGAHWRADRRLDVLHRVFGRHRDLSAFRRTATQPLGLRDEAIAGIAELLHTTLALIVDEFELALAQLVPQLEHACEVVEPMIARIAEVVPGLERASVELVWALGMHGRAFPDRILVGAPESWSGCTPARQAVLAAHEFSVLASEADDYFESEWDALVSLARRMQRIEDVELREAHASWLAELALDDLLRGLVARSQLSQGDARLLLDDPPSRARRIGS